MLFNSFSFLVVFLPGSLIAYRLLGHHAEWRVSLLSSPSTWNPNHTVPTGFSGEPPVGPAIPVTAMLALASECRTAPNAIARATTSLTAPCCAMRDGSTPS